MGRFARTASAAALLVLAGCTTSSGASEAGVPPSASEDIAYAPVLAKWHHYGSVVSEFQKKLEVNAVLFTDEFRRAYLDRFQRIRGESRNQLEEGLANRIVILVSLFSPERAYESLEDNRIWTLTLDYGTTSLGKPVVRSVSEKVILEPFFPFVNQWSREFLLAFDPASEGGVAALPQEVTLVLRSALATVKIPWNQKGSAK